MFFPDVPLITVHGWHLSENYIPLTMPDFHPNWTPLKGSVYHQKMLLQAYNTGKPICGAVKNPLSKVLHSSEL